MFTPLQYLSAAAVGIAVLGTYADTSPRPAVPMVEGSPGVEIAYDLATLAASSCPMNCWSFCDGGSVYTHVVDDREEDNAYGPEHNCMYTSLGCSYHACWNEEQQQDLDLDLEALLELLPTLGPQEISQLAERQSAVIVNASRRAIQVLGCDDRVVAHVSMSPQQVTALADD